jgi:hypothetical protein
VRARPLLIVHATAPPASNEGAIYAASVADTLEILQGFNYCADLELCSESSAWDWLQVKRRSDGPLIPEGRDHVVLFGTNTPSLPRAHVTVLLESAADLTFGPTEQGGFYAAACRSGGWVPLPGSCSLEEALAQAHRRGLRTALGSAWFAVQSRADLKRLDGYLPPRRSFQVLERLSLIPRRKRSSIR